MSAAKGKPDEADSCSNEPEVTQHERNSKEAEHEAMNAVLGESRKASRVAEFDMSCDSDDAALSNLGQNPLDNMSIRDILADADRFVVGHNLGEADHHMIRMGALAAKIQDALDGAEQIPQFNEDERKALLYEEKHPWKSTPCRLFCLAALCAGCAIVQGMDQTVINGAQDFYFKEFGITDAYMKGFLNGSPYIAAALLGCWLNAPLNRWFGRRGTIFISCAVAFITGIWQAASPNWGCFLAARLTLGIAVGAKSSTAPVYAAECAPKRIRGALTMMWQMWTAFGIMLGYIASIAFQNADFLGRYSQWRWMIGITSLPPMIVMSATYSLPESPRWYMDREDYIKAYKSMTKLRSHDILAARDLYVAYKGLQVERRSKKKGNSFKELLTVRRNRRAALSAWFCMFMQQFCGVNVIAYYSTQIFKKADFSDNAALWASFGCGALNWVGALPAVFTIDRFGRRKLLLITLPVLAICLFWTGANFQVEDLKTRSALLMASVFIFMFCYSPGLGPVPFTYAAEAFPLHIRAQGMASATAITWSLNFVLSFSWPKMMEGITPAGGFYYYATWNVIGFFVTYFFIPETKNRTLEELDAVFDIGGREHASHHWKKLKRGAEKLCGKDVGPMPSLRKRGVQVGDSSEVLTKPERGTGMV